MATGKRSSYTSEQRQAVLAAVRAKGVNGAAKEHGVPQSCVSRWASAAGVARGDSGPAQAAVETVAVQTETVAVPVTQKRRTSKPRVAKLYTPSQKAEVLEHAGVHGITAASEKFGISRFSIYDWRRKTRLAAKGVGQSPTSGPAPKDIEQRRDAEILEEWKSHPGLGPSQIVNQLRRKSIKVSVHTARRVMEDAGYRPPKVVRQRHFVRLLTRKAGRPTKPAPAPASADTVAITLATLAYVMSHPGCVDRGQRQSYAHGFRRFVLDLCAKHPGVAVETMAEAIAVPLGTLKDWLRAPAPMPAAASHEEPTGEPSAGVPTVEDGVDVLRFKSVIEAWRRWCGSFRDFCEHVRRDLHINFGRDLIAKILRVEGLRRGRARGTVVSDEIATRGSFRTYFPGAQWVGDGMQVPVLFGGERFVFNVELNVDAHTAAFVGVSVRDAEDSAAVIEAFDGGVATTGAPAIALLLDNRPSNHTPEVDEAIGDTLRIRATPERPQNKAHVEGAFGLFSQALPPLVLDTTGSARDQARRFLGLVVDVWAKTTNHRPRAGRNGSSRIDLYGDAIASDEQIAAARKELSELAERQQLARRTLEARRRPEVLMYLDDAFARLALLDPERHLRIAIAGYPKSAIASGVATFEGKRRAGTLPDGVDARYLLGIVKNVTAKTEGEIIAKMLWDERMRARDFFLAPLRAERDKLLAESEPEYAIGDFADHALATDTIFERTFWLETIVAVIREQPEDAREALFLTATRYLEAVFDVPPAERHDAVRLVAERLLSIE
jgi:transposase-like protein